MKEGERERNENTVGQSLSLRQLKKVACIFHKYGHSCSELHFFVIQ